ncbi:MAG: lytic polysaccharide monooxygenase [Gammaproteobacteria bacterium]|nr:lytic polysaccharide monooxygenase [Gammaproteobacteria bacterium]
MQRLKTTMGGFTLSAAVAALLFLHAPLATAHARWDLNGVVKPRTTATGLKSDPCGGAARTTAPVTFAPGQTLEVTFEETVQHLSHFRIAFSQAGDAGFDSNVLLDNIVDNLGPETPLNHLFRATITLPMLTCDACTLQLIQVMVDNPAAPSNYYSCSDIKLVNGGGTTPTPTPIPTITPTPVPTATPVPMPTPTPLPALTDLKQIAQNLLEDFVIADTDKSNSLTLSEAQMVLPGLALDSFSNLDSNLNGMLSKEELNAAINPSAKNQTKAAASMEWITLLGLLPFALRRVRKSRDLGK